ncbi:histidine phosphatase family protein [Epidermidibacterium keratini]|uniref:Histidine phosphatase family protein n=1 Tax=Epidermidibacterium keratini TaxID=1891644 RepID=A0A7L4YPK7_9ACTN|nr:histidine phosphatase family protein [Epidermidibacterium keratini]QHC00833.1 histidine phosphatase family protein [Epidermidibacterium keratini]
MAELIFVRHGQSTWNLERRVQGQSHEPPLTDLGRRQASAAADFVRTLGAQAIFSSDQVRAAQTAEIIGERCQVAVRHDQRLREHDHGELTGMLSSAAMAAWSADPHAASDPDAPYDPDLVHGRTGESPRQVADRFARFAADVRGHDGRIVVVSHGTLIQTALAVIAGEDLARMTWHAIANGDVINAAGEVIHRSEADVAVRR